MPGPRPKVRPTQGLHNLGKGGNPDAKYVTNCKLCRQGIYRDQPHRWFSRPIGLSHDSCAAREGLL